MDVDDKMLKVAEVAAELRCSLSHAYKAILGRVAGVSALPAVSMGRRKLVRRSSLEQWKRQNERTAPGVTIDPSLKESAVDA